MFGRHRRREAPAHSAELHLDDDDVEVDLVASKWANVHPGVCDHFGVEMVAADPALNCGVSRNVIDGRYATDGVFPLTGIRHPVEHGTSGWYVWAGEYSEADDFFVPVHTGHLEFYCPDLAVFLGMPPGWWIEIAADGSSKAGYDPHLLDT